MGAPVLVAMSGGVDSSVAAALLQRNGYDVTGVTMKLWGGDQDTGCCSVADVDDARRVADQLAIPHHVFNFGDDFDRLVVQPYVDAHARGSTPNPCIECNRHLKFDKLLRRATALGFHDVATGHHARVVTVDGGRRVARGADAGKDQSYVLHMLTTEQLGRVMFPLGDLTKAEVRQLAGVLGLRTADKPDSQDVCFITQSKGGRQRFLEERLPLTPGSVVDATGAEVGRVDAVELVTIGQRKGLGVSGSDEPAYAVGVDVATATVTIGTRQDLFTHSTPIVEVVWVHQPTDAQLNIQTSAHGRVATGSVDDGQILWASPHYRVAAGQSVVFYVDDVVVGGALAAPNRR